MKLGENNSGIEVQQKVRNNIKRYNKQKKKSLHYLKNELKAKGP